MTDENWTIIPAHEAVDIYLRGILEVPLYNFRLQSSGSKMRLPEGGWYSWEIP